MMGLYLCILDDNSEELDGVEVGSYSDWGAFVSAVIEIEGGQRGSRYPLLTMHSDCDGEWRADECGHLAKELEEIAAAFKKCRPTPPMPGTWQANVAKGLGLRFKTLYDCFIDVDGENLISRLQGLAETAYKVQWPVLFQ